MSVDPLADKYPAWSTYNYVMGNPIMLIDPTGKGPTDFFVNNLTGTVIYIKGDSKVTQEKLDKLGSTFKPSDYERLGDDKMFGNEVEFGPNEKILDKEVFSFLNYSESFMSGEGYEKGERVKMQEKEFTSGGSEGPTKNRTTTSYSSKELSGGKLTYVKPDQMYNIDVLSDKTSSGDYSSIRTVTYNTIVPDGENNADHLFFESDSNNKGLSTGLDGLNTILELIDLIF